MRDDIQLTVLVENSVRRRGLRGEHGLAFHIHTGRRRLLFDTGQSDLLVRNAEVLGIRLEQVEAIVLSHGHYDHTGGLSAAREAAPGARVFLHPAAAEPKFAANPGGRGRPVGMAEASVRAIREAAAADRVVWTTGTTEVIDGVFVTGEIPRDNDFEDVGGRFLLDAAGTRPDPLVDDQALFFDTEHGLVVILGCAHAGVINTLDSVRRLTRDRPIHAVLGGLHLLNADAGRVTRTIEAFRRWNIQRLVPGHCTGMSATAQIGAAFTGRCSDCSVGTTMTFRR
jgi:7,8-dihydropterin-6-yl-methyl-4-(beta-D-ribofuranosyl)aminobenzene 5'-phosphate synthase